MLPNKHEEEIEIAGDKDDPAEEIGAAGNRRHDESGSVGGGAEDGPPLHDAQVIFPEHFRRCLGLEILFEL